MASNAAVPPPSSRGYDNQAYWDERYSAQDGAFDWYMRWKDVSAIIGGKIGLPSLTSSALSASDSSVSSSSQPTALSSATAASSPSPGTTTIDLDDECANRKANLATLVVGCGNSTLSNDMLRDGFTSIVSMDYSDVVIAQMKQQYPAGRYEVGDVTDMTKLYEPASFDLIIDKGTLDAILCGGESVRNCSLMLMQVSRVLKSGGHFIIITYGTPSSRLPYLTNATYKWRVEHDSLEENRFMYTMTKKS